VEVLAGCVEESEGGAVDDALRTYVAEAAGSHLSVLGVALSVELLVEGFGGVVGDHDAIGDGKDGILGTGGEQALRMP